MKYLIAILLITGLILTACSTETTQDPTDSTPAMEETTQDEMIVPDITESSEVEEVDDALAQLEDDLALLE